MKEYYKHGNTGEILDELPDDMHWTDRQFWYYIVELDLDKPCVLYDPDFDIASFEPPNMLIFVFNSDEYIW